MFKVIELLIDPTISGETGVFEVAWVENPAIEQDFMYFSEQKFYKAPDYVAAKACQAIKENEKRGNPAGTQVGKVRAQQLCNQTDISLETIKRMKSFLSRAATYDTGNWDDNGTIAMGLWGGKEALTWVNKILNQEEDMGIQDFVYPSVGESKDEFISRCIAYVIKEGKTEDEAAGQCYGMWENQKFAIGDKVSFDWDDTLDTKNGRELLEQEMSRGSLIYIISARNITTQEMIDLANKYGFPATHIYTTGSNKKKVEKIKELGIKRHYDNNLNVIQELGPVGIKFDYDLILPSYDNYPASGDTDAMLIEPELFSCGCGDFMEHDFSDWDEEELELKKYFDFLKETREMEFEYITNPMLRGFTVEEIKTINHKNPTKYYLYKRVLEGFPDRPFCNSLEGRYFRRSQIYALENFNKEFGHQKKAYSKWLYKGGPNCVHAWEEYSAIGTRIENRGMVGGTPGTPPKNLPNNGYYSEETKRKSEIAYIISQQNMSSVSLMDEKQIECAFGDLCGFALENKGQSFAALQEKRMIYTPLMIPNILIPRIDEVSQEKYYVKFTPETIEKIAQKFMIEQRLRDTNLEHTDKKFSDIVMVESWIIEGEKDKAYELGFSPSDLPPGTWMGGYKVLDTPEGNFVWDNYVKKGKVRGASVEGNFILNFSVQKTDDYLLSQIINILQQITD